VADLARSRILAQTAIAISRGGPQALLSF
jgi:hypothetical protein